MKKRYALPLFLASIVIIAFAAVAGSGSTSDLPGAPAIGTTLDDFKLPDADGAEHSLKSLTGKNGAVLIFVATKCPVSNAYNDRMEKLAQDYKAKGINVIGINSNNTEPAAEVKSHAGEKHLTFTILKDDGNKIADRLGAEANAGSLCHRCRRQARLSRPHRQLAEHRQHYGQRSARCTRRTDRGQAGHQDRRRCVRLLNQAGLVEGVAQVVNLRRVRSAGFENRKKDAS